MRCEELRVDVAEATGIAGAALAASLYLPDAVPDDLELLVCLHGGGYRRDYWHPAFQGFSGYSFAEALTEKGRAVLAVDLLGMGDSSRPEPETLLDRAKIAAANDVAVKLVATGLRDGRWAKASRLRVTGVGHSIGGMMVITQQAAHRSFARLAVLGWANQRMVLGDTDPETLALSIQPGYLATPREMMRGLFYAADVPLALVAADEAAGSTTPACLGRDALRPGIVHGASAAVTCPVFLAHGVVDTSPAPHQEPGYFKGSSDVTLLVLQGSAHCHNFARTRQVLWDRLDAWLNSVGV